MHTFTHCHPRIHRNISLYTITQVRPRCATLSYILSRHATSRHTTLHAVAWRGVAWRGVAWRGMAWHVMAWNDIRWVHDRARSQYMKFEPLRRSLLNMAEEAARQTTLPLRFLLPHPSLLSILPIHRQAFPSPLLPLKQGYQ